jgi:hypothetical protein
MVLPTVGEPLLIRLVTLTINLNIIIMSQSTDKSETQKQDSDKQQRDAERIETNKTDPQITELKGFIDSDEPLEEEGTLNPLTGNRETGE